MFKSLFLREFNIPYNGEQEFDQLSGIISDFNKYIENSYKLEKDSSYSEQEKQDILKKRYQISQNVWNLAIHPKLERMKQMDPNNVKFLGSIYFIS